MARFCTLCCLRRSASRRPAPQRCAASCFRQTRAFAQLQLSVSLPRQRLHPASDQHTLQDVSEELGSAHSAATTASLAAWMQLADSLCWTPGLPVAAVMLQAMPWARLCQEVSGESEGTKLPVGVLVCGQHAGMVHRAACSLAVQAHWRAQAEQAC